MSVGAAVQALWEVFVAAVKLMGGAQRVVQEVGVWLEYLQSIRKVYNRAYLYRGGSIYTYICRRDQLPPFSAGA